MAAAQSECCSQEGLTVKEIDQRLVDYETQAAAYQIGRAVTDEQLAVWWKPISERLPVNEAKVVLDVGAGTGSFLGLWRSLPLNELVAIEPSPMMRAIASERSIATRVVFGTLESLPFGPGAADIVWISAALHHTRDIGSALHEIARVLRHRGRVFFRGYFPDRSHVPWLEHFPGRERAMARFPTATALRKLLPNAGLALIDVVDVEEGGELLPAHAASWIAAMRSADSLLTAFTDDEIHAGVSALLALPREPLPPVRLTLITAERLVPA